jgi:hypothetical protein
MSRGLSGHRLPGSRGGVTFRDASAVAIPKIKALFDKATSRLP